MSDSAYLVPLEAVHFEQIEMRQREINRLRLIPGADGFLASLPVYGTGGTIFYQGRILGIIGYTEMWPGRYLMWAWPSVHVPEYPLAYLRMAKRYLQRFEETFKPVRIQTEAYADDLHTAWMQFLGFENETPNGMRRSAADDATMNLWAKVYTEVA